MADKEFRVKTGLIVNSSAVINSSAVTVNSVPLVANQATFTGNVVANGALHTLTGNVAANGARTMSIGPHAIAGNVNFTLGNLVMGGTTVNVGANLNVIGRLAVTGNATASNVTVSGIFLSQNLTRLDTHSLKVRDLGSINSNTTLDLANANFFIATITGGPITFSLSNVPGSGNAVPIILELTNGGSNVINWWTGAKFPNNTAPTLTASGIDVIAGYTRNGGTNSRIYRAMANVG